MRVLVALLLACAARADTVAQLVGKVRDGLAAGRGDAEMAEAVAGTRLTERLDDAAIEALGAGPLTTEALETARDSSERLPRAAAIRLFDPPPAPSREE